MKLIEAYGKTALVAGASEGIGAAFATLLASEGMDLFLIARRSEPLQQLADELGSKYKVKITCIVCDLGSADSSRQIFKQLEGTDIDLLVYNAALSHMGPFIETTLENHSLAVQVNIMTPLHMVYLFGKKMLERGRGAVILMTSLAGLQGSGYLSVYAATKAFSRILGESLWYEWKNRGVDVIACCAGATATPGFRNSQPGKKSIFAPRVLQPGEVASECLKKLGKQPSFITGRGNRAASFIMQKFLSRRMAVTVMGNNTKKMYRL